MNTKTLLWIALAIAVALMITTPWQHPSDYNNTPLCTEGYQCHH